jgi:hypothetical protein
MTLSVCLSAVALTALFSDADARLLARAEGTPLVFNRRPTPRVERDAAGAVVRLRLDGLHLSAKEFLAIGRLTHLRSLSLCRTNATDADLRLLRTLTHLESLNLTSTGISDAAVEDIQAFESLRSLCLGEVAMTPEAVARLKERFPRLRLGYSQRRR